MPTVTATSQVSPPQIVRQSVYLLSYDICSPGHLALTWVVLLSMLAIPLLFAQAVFASIYSSRIGQPFFSAGAHTWRELTPGMVAVADIPLAFIAWFALLSVIWLMLHRGAVKLQVLVALAGLVAAVSLLVAALPSTPIPRSRSGR